MQIWLLLKRRIERKIDTLAYSTKQMSAKKYCKAYNVVLTKTELFKPESCEYYLHFNVKLPYPEKEQKKWNIKLSNRRSNCNNR